MNKRAIGAVALILALVGMGAGFMSAQEQYSNTLNQIGNYFGAGNSFFSLLIGNPFFLIGVVAFFVGVGLLVTSSGSAGSGSSSSPSSSSTMPPSRPTAPTSGTKPCPFCAEPIQAAAVVCRWCGRDIP